MMDKIWTEMLHFKVKLSGLDFDVQQYVYINSLIMLISTANVESEKK